MTELPPWVRELATTPKPMRPLAGPALRAAVFAAVSATGLALFAIVIAARGGWRELEPAMFWLPIAARLGLGGLLMWLSFRAGVPGLAWPRARAFGVLALVPVLVVVSAEWVAAGLGPMPVTWTPDGLTCFRHELQIALPLLVGLGVLLARAYPIGAPLAFALGASGSGLFADSVLHALCPRADTAHAVLAHGGAVAALTALAALIGWLWERRSA